MNNKRKGSVNKTFKKSKLTQAVDKVYKKYANGFERPSLLLDLEPRMMFDGAAPAVVDDMLDDSKEPLPESLPEPTGTPEVQAEQVNNQVEGIADSLEIADDSQDDLVSSDSNADIQEILGMDGVLDSDSGLLGAESLTSDNDQLNSLDADLGLSNDVVMELDAELTSPIASTEANLDSQEQELMEEETVEADESEEQQENEAVVEEEKPVSRVVFIDTSD